jgi:nicotinamidase-related amidase
MRTAILVIDVQQGLCVRSDAAHDGAGTLARINTVACKALALGCPFVLVADAHTSAGNESLSPQQIIAHHNATLTSIASFGPRVTAVTAAALQVHAA